MLDYVFSECLSVVQLDVCLVPSVCGVCVVSVWCAWYWCAVFVACVLWMLGGLLTRTKGTPCRQACRVLWLSSGGSAAIVFWPAVLQHFIFFCCHAVIPMTGWSHVEIIHVHNRVIQWSDNTHSFITRLPSDNLVHISDFRSFHLRVITYLHVGWETLKWKPCVSCDYHGVLLDNWVL